uniref:Long-chain-fatty-acid--CoA ligase n=1 Tax=uncultured bacterium esnapd17 TaxID=1366598 RepID=S5TV27_9BACT|nr:long-chain-fatty-acid--CoA ligase [uncultured bacterium esnapd17]
MDPVAANPAEYDSGTVADVERAVAAAPGVQDTAVAVRRFRRPAATPATVAVEPAPQPASKTIATGAEPPPVTAIVEGPPLILPPDTPKTLQEALRQAAELAPEKGTTYVLADGTEDRQTYAQLLTDSTRVLGGLQELGLQPGDAVLLQCADNRNFVTTFWACVLGGFLPTPVGPAPGYTKDNAVTRKLHAAWDLLGKPLIVTDEALREQVGGLPTLWGEDGVRIAAVEGLDGEGRPADVDADQPVVNLLTSGSTGTPKCVQHRNRSIISRTVATIAANGFTPDDVSLNWMPLDHVGGIIMYNVRDVVLRCEHVNARTDAFVQRPTSWLDWIDKYRATNTWAPNFAFALVCEQVEEIARGSWDLSSMLHICNAGEAVVARTAHRFLDLLAPHQLPADAMVPCWGMSETSSGVTYARLRRRHPSVGTVCVDPRSLTEQLVEVPHGTAQAVVLTEVGPPIAGVSLRIVDEDGQPLPEGRVGRLHVTGATMLAEYYRNPAANEAAFTEDGWFDTGDLGFLRHGRLTLTGRLKDMIIVNGANYPAHDLESVVSGVDGVQATNAAVCGVHDPALGTDAVVVFFVPTGGADVGTTVATIRTALARETGLRPNFVVPVPPDAFPKTESGKIQRNQLVESWQAGRLQAYTDESAEDAEAPTEAWLLERVYAPAPVVPAPLDEPVLVYARADDPLAGVLAQRFPATVIVDGQECRGTDDGVALDLRDAEQHRRALSYLESVPARVIYCLAASPAPEQDLDGPATELLLALRALAEARPDADVTVLTRHALRVDERDLVDPARATLPALVRTAQAEGTVGAIRLLDVPVDVDAADILAAGQPAGTEIAAVRDGTAYVERLRVVEEPPGLAIPADLLRPGGTVLLTGGLGGLGAQVAQYLLAAVSARLLVVGRTPEAQLTPARAAVLEELRDLGEVDYVALDVADAGALRDAVAKAEQRWDAPLDVVLHLAGVDVRAQWDDLGAHTLANEQPAWLADMLAPKLGGARAIDSLLAERPDTSVVLFSSVNGFFGGSSFGAYAAANAGLDGYALRWAAQGRTARSLAWSMWTDTGMNQGSPLTAAAEHRGLRAIDASRGLALLLATLNQDRPYLLVGADPDHDAIRPLLADDQLDGAEIVVAVVGDVAAAQAAVSHVPGVRVVGVQEIPRHADGRLNVKALTGPARRAYDPPEGELETAIAEILAEVVKQERVGRDDSFFTLGGDSLRAMQVVGRLKERLREPVPVSLLYEHPSPRELAAALSG